MWFRMTIYAQSNFLNKQINPEESYLLESPNVMLKYSIRKLCIYIHQLQSQLCSDNSNYLAPFDLLLYKAEPEADPTWPMHMPPRHLSNQCSKSLDSHFHSVLFI